MPWRLISAELGQELAELDQIDGSKRRSAAGQKPELIRCCNIGERSGDRAKALVFANIDNPILTPMPTPADQVEFAAGMRMKRMRDAHLATGRIHTTRS